MSDIERVSLLEGELNGIEILNSNLKEKINKGNDYLL